MAPPKDPFQDRFKGSSPRTPSIFDPQPYDSPESSTLDSDSKDSSPEGDEARAQTSSSAPPQLVSAQAQSGQKGPALPGAESKNSAAPALSPFANPILMIVFFSLAGLAVGIVMIWKDWRQIRISEPDYGTFKTITPGSFPPEDRRLPSQPAPVEAVDPHEVIREAALNRGELYVRGSLESRSKKITLQSGAARLNPGRTEVEIIFSEQPEAEGKSAPPVLTLKAGLAPFGTDCSLLGMKQYTWILGAPFASPPTVITRDSADPKLHEIDRLGCKRRRPDEVLEISAQAELPIRNTRGKDTAALKLDSRLLMK